MALLFCADTWYIYGGRTLVAEIVATVIVWTIVWALLSWVAFSTVSRIVGWATRVGRRHKGPAA